MTIPMQAIPVLKVICVDDLGVEVVELPTGTYLIDGEVVTGVTNWQANTRQVSVKDTDNIRLISKVRTLVGHVPAQEGITDDVLSVDSYNDFVLELRKGSPTDEDGDIQWKDLESEFAYRKFVSNWKPKYKEETVYSEPYLVERTYIKQDSGNPYIKAGFLTGRADVPLYSYSRTEAVADLLAKKFQSLGMEFVQGVNYGATEGKKVWGNSTHSGLEFVTAFGGYLFKKPDLPKTRGEFKGSLEYLEGIYKEDKKWIEDLIQTHYNLHFRNKAASGVLLSEVRQAVKSSISFVNTMDVKVKSETSKRSALNKLNGLLKLVDKEILEGV